MSPVKSYLPIRPFNYDSPNLDDVIHRSLTRRSFERVASSFFVCGGGAWEYGRAVAWMCCCLCWFGLRWLCRFVYSLMVVDWVVDKTR